MKTATMSPQCRRVLKHLQEVGPLTPLSALVNYGTARLAARVHELNEMGYVVLSEMKTVNHKRYASYSLVG